LDFSVDSSAESVNDYVAAATRDINDVVVILRLSATANFVPLIFRQDIGRSQINGTVPFTHVAAHDRNKPRTRANTRATNRRI